MRKQPPDEEERDEKREKMAGGRRDGLPDSAGAADFVVSNYSGRGDYWHGHHMVCLEVTRWVI